MSVTNYQMTKHDGGSDYSAYNTLAIYGDGFRVDIIERAMPLFNRTRPRSYSYRMRDYRKTPRIYVSSDDSRETVMDDIMNRTRRPYTIYRQLINKWFDEVGIEIGNKDFYWSQRAGCSMCPCSPGFVSRTKTITVFNGVENKTFRNFDIFLTLKDAPMVDENAPERNVTVLL
jgi:hypothetical protein